MREQKKEKEGRRERKKFSFFVREKVLVLPLEVLQKWFFLGKIEKITSFLPSRENGKKVWKFHPLSLWLSSFSHSLDVRKVRERESDRERE